MFLYRLDNDIGFDFYSAVSNLKSVALQQEAGNSLAGIAGHLLLLRGLAYPSFPLRFPFSISMPSLFVCCFSTGQDMPIFLYHFGDTNPWLTGMHFPVFLHPKLASNNSRLPKNWFTVCTR